MRTKSTLPKKRIWISFILFLCIPIGARILNIFVKQYDISLMFMMNIMGAIIIYYNWNLFGVHYNRAKYHLLDTLLYYAIGTVIIGIWVWFSLNILHARIIAPSASVLQNYGYARIGMYIAYSFMESTVIAMTFKCLTDRIVVRKKELQMILLTGMIMGVLLTLCFLPSTNILTILTTLLFNVILMILLAYFYNQSRSFIPGALAMGTVYLFSMIFWTFI